MQAIQQVMNEIVNRNITEKHSSRTCSICGNLVPAILVNVLGMERWVQPKCPCEAKVFDAEIQQLQQSKIDSEIRQLFAISNIGDKYLKADFHNFEMREGAENAFKIAQHYAQHFAEFGGDGVMFWGDPGNGKTHLAAAVHNYLKAQGKTIVFISMPDLLSKIKATFNRNSRESEADILRALAICDLLIIDDLGAERVSDWVQETVFTIIDSRYRRNKPILATSNLYPDDLPQQLGKRVCDRLTAICQPIENKASSYRQEVQENRLYEKFSNILNTDKEPF